MIPQLETLRIIFFGTANFAAYHLYRLLYCSAHKIIAIFTQETKNCNSKYFLSIIKIAQTHNLLLFQSNVLAITDIIYIIKKLHADIIIVTSYGLILPQDILNIPRFGCINIHASLLPRWRGAAPIQRALEHGDLITGISIIQMDPKIDTGNILCSTTCRILPKDTYYTLSNKLAHIGATTLLQTIDKIILKKCHIIPQNSLCAIYANKINKKESKINWNISAIQLERRIRAFNPWPGNYFLIQQHRIKIWNAKAYNYPTANILPGTILKVDSCGIHVSTGSGILVLTKLQISGKRNTSSIKDILNSHRNWFFPNSILK